MRRAHPTQTFASVAAIGVFAIFGIPGVPSLEDFLGGSSRDSDKPTRAEWRAMGSTSAPDRVLRKGCHNYSFSYRVKPPDGTTKWALAVALEDKHDRGIGNVVITSGNHANRGTKAFRICRTNTTYGKFTIGARLTIEKWPDRYDGRIKDSHFWLRRP